MNVPESDRLPCNSTEPTAKIGFKTDELARLKKNENVPESLRLPASRPEPTVQESKFIIESTEGYRVDWKALAAFHTARSRDPQCSEYRRRWHAAQVRVIKARHRLEASEVYSWSAHCAAVARELARSHSI